MLSFWPEWLRVFFQIIVQLVRREKARRKGEMPSSPSLVQNACSISPIRSREKCRGAMFAGAHHRRIFENFPGYTMAIVSRS